MINDPNVAVDRAKQFIKDNLQDLCIELVANKAGVPLEADSKTVELRRMLFNISNSHVLAESMIAYEAVEKEAQK